MKKLLAAVLALAMLLFAAAFAETVEATETVETDGTDMAGIWYMREMILEDGTTLRPEAMGMVFTIELLESGAAVMRDTRGVYQQVDKGVWRQEGSMLSVVIDDDFSILLRAEGSVLTTERNETHTKWVFRRDEPEEVYEPAEAVPAELEEYTGRWTVVRVQVAELYYSADILSANPGVTIDGETLILNEGMPFGTTPVTMRYENGMLKHDGLEEEPVPIITPEPTPSPTPEATPTPEPEPIEIDGVLFVPSPTPVATPTPTVTPTPTPEPTIEPRLRTSRYDLTAQLLEDDTLSLSIGLDSERLVVFILCRG